MGHPLRCRCGALTGEVGSNRAAIRAVCYCKDCQAYAYHLGSEKSVLDAIGGSDIVATQARYVTLDRGVENLACISFSKRGPLRWYAKCCNTPLANTPRSRQIPYVALLHSCLKKPLEASFPRVQLHVHIKSAKGAPPSTRRGRLTALLGFIATIVLARLSGAYRRTPFFSRDGAPVVDVKVLSGAEREQAKRAAG